MIIMATKKQPNICQALIQIDIFLYDKIVKAGNLFVGFDSCKVYDAIEVNRCFNCNEYHHFSSKCSKLICSGNHDLKQCTSEKRCGSNCAKLAERQ